MNDEHNQVRHILERAPDDYLMKGFEEAPTNVLQHFVECAEEPEFQHKKHLKSQVKSLLEARKNDSSNRSLKFSAESAKWSQKSYPINLAVLIISIITLVLTIIQILKH